MCDNQISPIEEEKIYFMHNTPNLQSKVKAQNRKHDKVKSGPIQKHPCTMQPAFKSMENKEKDPAYMKISSPILLNKNDEGRRPFEQRHNSQSWVSDRSKGSENQIIKKGE
ncbi:transcription termination/antitermination protein NusG [Striga asiatica]|uniref:Transcription termination/antitermination protein NusG n=1 Tax=Striga asiatica TaxID=4170 RepID=A0A5A7PJK0_STRAF|nr:transcription termination/antitermination protein NusG [Striga asiatica]